VLSGEVDEAHWGKNLPFATKLDRVKGLPNPTECQRATDLFLKTQWLLERGGGIVFATGTPIANTIAESWTMARYLMRDKLEELGLHHFDAWAKLFADDIVNLYPGAWCSALVISIEEASDAWHATDMRTG
jgi:N12 class adenine-specific DNA methylase